MTLARKPTSIGIGFPALVYLILAIPVPLWLWFNQTGSLAPYFDGSAPPGQWLYVLSKLLGMVALSGMAWQVIIMLMSKMSPFPAGWTRVIHPLAGSLILMAALAHFLLFFFAVTARQGSPAWGLLLPNTKDFYHTHLTFGLVGLWLLCLVVVTGLLRKVGFFNAARSLHKVYWLVIGLIYLHALAVGSESQSMVGLLYYLGLGGALILALLITRFLGKRLSGRFTVEWSD